MKNGNYYSLTKEQAIEGYELLKRKAFNYNNFDKKVRYVIKKQKKRNSNRAKFEETRDRKYSNNESNYKKNTEKCDFEEVLSLIFNMQMIILKFVNSNLKKVD